MSEQDVGRVATPPGSHPSGHAGCAVDGAPRVDPSRGMVERVARALAIADGKDPDAPAWVRGYGRREQAFGICWRDQYSLKARSAIEAMREPTRAMEDAADDCDERLPFVSTPLHAAEGDVHWRAMIDAALRDSDRHPEGAKPRQEIPNE